MMEPTMDDGPTIPGQLRVKHVTCSKCGENPRWNDAQWCRACVTKVCCRPSHKRGERCIHDRQAWLRRMGQIDRLMNTSLTVDIPDEVLRSLTAAATPEALAAVELPAGEIPWNTPNGLMMLDTPTGDGRTFLAEGYGVDKLPLPLTFNHDDTLIAGRVIEVDPTGSAGMPPRASGVFDDSDFGREMARHVALRNVKGISADLRVFEYDITLIEDEEGVPVDSEFVGTRFNVMGASIAPHPGFADAEIALGVRPAAAPVDMAASGNVTTVATTGFVAAASAIKAIPAETTGLAAADIQAAVMGEIHKGIDDRLAAEMTAPLRAAGGPVAPPREWFDDPHFTELTPLTVSDDSQRIYGHLAPWPTGEGHTGCHIGSSDVCLCAEPSRAGYAYFLTGEMLCADGTRLPVGTLSLSGGHAPDDGRTPLEAINAHYDNTDSAAAYLNAGDDEFGPWVAGVVRAGITDEDLQALRCSSPSVHEREIAGNLELVRVCCVNTPGLPVLRASGGALPDFPRPFARVDSDGRVVERVSAEGARRLAARKGRMMAPPTRDEYEALEARLELAEAGLAEQARMLRTLDPTVRAAALSTLLS